MNRREFIRELEYLLQDIPEEEKADAIAYYRDYLEDAGEEQEEDVIREFGSPERVAAIIRADLRGDLDSGGEFTESGYQDERFRDPRYQVAERHRGLEDSDGQRSGKGRFWNSHTSGWWRTDRQGTSGEDQSGYSHSSDWFQGEEGVYSGEGRKQGRHRGGLLSKGSAGSQVLKIILILALICVLSPVLLGLGGGIVGIAAGFLTLLIAVVLLAGVLTAAAWIGAAALLVLGVGMLFAYPWSGVLIIGCGVFVLGLACLGVAVSVLVYGKLVPFCLCSVVNWINRLLYRGRRDRT